jgi:hypothetical protein
LEELEGKAREFEVMSNISLPKLLNLLESKEGQLQDLKHKEKSNDVFLNQVKKQKENEVEHIKKRAN